MVVLKLIEQSISAQTGYAHELSQVLLPPYCKNYQFWIPPFSLTRIRAIQFLRCWWAVMSDPNEHTQTGGATSHVGDCYIWAEIYYLDSATDYRECLMPKVRNPQSDFGDLVMLDEITPTPLWVVLRNVAGRAVSILHAINNVARLCLWIQS